MTPRIFALALTLLTLAACDTRVPPTMSNPSGDPTKVAACTGENCKEHHSFFHNMMPWNWF
jgi:hypothetical protein